jgi:hypothetical protein
MWEVLRVRRSRGIGALLCGLVALGGGAGAAAAPGVMGPPTYGPTRAWGGTDIRSLDPSRSVADAADAGAADAPAARGVHPDKVLSNEWTFTRWAYVDQTAWIHAAPRFTARRIGQLTWYTEDGFSSVYLVLRAHWNARGREWVKLRIPGRPNGQTGWVPRDALGSFHLTHLLIVVNREQLRMYFYRDGRRLWSAPVGVGKPSSPTPAGRFWINERFEITDPGSGYYPYAFGTTDYSTLTDWPGGGVVGIHGPYYDAQGIPGFISHGCIRLRVPDDFWLAAVVRLGTPVHVV